VADAVRPRLDRDHADRRRGDRGSSRGARDGAAVDARRKARGGAEGADGSYGSADVEAQMPLPANGLRPVAVGFTCFGCRVSVDDSSLWGELLVVDGAFDDELSDEVHSGSLGAHLPVDPCDLSPGLGELATQISQLTEEAPQEQTPSDGDAAERTRDNDPGHATSPYLCARSRTCSFLYEVLDRASENVLSSRI